MKNHRTVLKAVAAAVLACTAGFASAADTTNLLVSASVLQTCKFRATSTPLGFGAIDPSLTTDRTMTANVLYRCTTGTLSAGVTATGGLTRSMAGSGTAALQTLAYTLGFANATGTGTGFGAGQDLTMVVTGTITPAAFQNATVGPYAETVVLNITP